MFFPIYRIHLQDPFTGSIYRIHLQDWEFSKTWHSHIQYHTMGFVQNFISYIAIYGSSLIVALYTVCISFLCFSNMDSHTTIPLFSGNAPNPLCVLSKIVLLHDKWLYSENTLWH